MRKLFVVFSFLFVLSTNSFSWTNDYNNPGCVINIFAGDYSSMGSEYKNAFIVFLSDGKNIVFHSGQPQADHWFAMCMTSKKTGVGIAFEHSNMESTFYKVNRLVLK